jgi:NCS1 family nucleobase:cation symporter-1
MRRATGFFEKNNVNNAGRYSPHQMIAAEHRVFGGRDLFSLWFSLGVGLMVLQLGALLAPGLGMSGALLAIVSGTAVGVILLGAVAVIGSDTGLSSMANLKRTLGDRGAVLPALLNLGPASRLGRLRDHYHARRGELAGDACVWRAEWMGQPRALDVVLRCAGDVAGDHRPADLRPSNPA